MDLVRWPLGRGTSANNSSIKVRLKEQRLGPVRPRMPQSIREPSVRQLLQSVQRQGGSSPVAAQLLNLCGEVFTDPAPAGVGAARYDETASSMVGLLKYGAGLPFHRIEVLQRGLGIPLPAATQWELVRDAAGRLAPVFAELQRQAAQGELVHNDDTVMKILALTVAQRRAAAADAETDGRTGVFTSAIVALCGPYRIALFFTGRRHAGENLAAVLAQRAAELGPPIQMSDGLAANTAGDFATILANCLAHARRHFVDMVHSFPAEVRVVLEILRDVYRNDALTREQGPPACTSTRPRAAR